MVERKDGGIINIYTSIAWSIENREIKISTDSGRSCRPIFIAENIKKFNMKRICKKIAK